MPWHILPPILYPIPRGVHSRSQKIRTQTEQMWDQVANLKNVEYGMSIILSELYTNKRAAACLTSIQSTHCAIMLTDLHREHYACHSMVTYHGYTERNKRDSILSAVLSHALTPTQTHTQFWGSWTTTPKQIKVDQLYQCAPVSCARNHEYD